MRPLDVLHARCCVQAPDDGLKSEDACTRAS